MVKFPLIKKFRAASEVLEDAVSNHQADRLSVGDLMQALHERGFGILLIIFALPNCVPIPLPFNVPSICGIPLMFFTMQMLLGMDSPWLPRTITRRSVRREMVAKIVALASPRLKKIEKILRARYYFASSKTGERVIGFFGTLFAISITIPLPWTNFLPAWGIMFMSLGLLSKDGVMILIGLLIGTIGVGVTTFILIFGSKALMYLLA